jgi:hypothetical protein
VRWFFIGLLLIDILHPALVDEAGFRMDATRVPHGRSPNRQTAAAHAACRKAPASRLQP